MCCTALGCLHLSASAFLCIHWLGEFPSTLVQTEAGRHAEAGRHVQPKVGAAEDRHYQLQQLKL